MNKRIGLGLAASYTQTEVDESKSTEEFHDRWYPLPDYDSLAKPTLTSFEAEKHVTFNAHLFGRLLDSPLSPYGYTELGIDVYNSAHAYGTFYDTTCHWYGGDGWLAPYVNGAIGIGVSYQVGSTFTIFADIGMRNMSLFFSGTDRFVYYPIRFRVVYWPAFLKKR